MAEIDLNAFFEAEFAEHQSVAAASAAALAEPFGRLVDCGVQAIRGGGKVCWRFITLHNPLVIVLSIIPGFGGFAYLTAGPLRRMTLIRLMIDRIGRKIPFRLYSRSRIDRLVAPSPHKFTGNAPVEPGTTTPAQEPQSPGGA